MKALYSSIHFAEYDFVSNQYRKLLKVWGGDMPNAIHRGESCSPGLSVKQHMFFHSPPLGRPVVDRNVLTLSNSLFSWITIWDLPNLLTCKRVRLSDWSSWISVFSTYTCDKLTTHSSTLYVRSLKVCLFVLFQALYHQVVFIWLFTTPKGTGGWEVMENTRGARHESNAVICRFSVQSCV